MLGATMIRTHQACIKEATNCPTRYPGHLGPVAGDNAVPTGDIYTIPDPAGQLLGL
jgi:hypothetical protein